jgi:Putative Ig domain
VYVKRVGRIAWLPGFVVIAGLMVLLTVGLSGCGAGGSSNQPIDVSLSSNVAGNAIDQAQTVSITASVTNDSKSAGVTWSVSGTSGSQGTLSGQTTMAVTYNAPPTVTSAFTATVTATSITDATKSASLQIKVSPLPSITTTSLPAATAGVAYSSGLSVSGGTSPYSWTVTSGTLPAGLFLNSASGVIAGTATGATSASLTFKVTDAAGNSASKAITLTVNPPPALTITPGSLAGAALGVAYSQTLQAAGGVPSYSWSVTSGSLPAGLSLSSSGVISGTPSGTTGTSNFTVKVTDSQTPTPATSSASLSITVSIAPLSITTTSLSGGVTGTAYSQTLQANGGNPPYTWSITLGTLPANLSLNTSTGAIAGTPTATGTSSFTVKVTDSAQASATASLSITINGALAITTTSLPGGSVGALYSSTVQASGGATPYTWKITSGNLPAGFSLNSTSANISGTPTATGTSSFTIQVTDSESPAVTVSAGLSITIGAQGCTNNGVLKGNYAFVTTGWSSTTTAASIGGSFLADGNGNITAGLADVADQNSAPTTQSGTFTGTYCVDSNNLATMNLTYAGGLAGSNTFAAALDSSDSNGHIISYDGSARKVSGLLRRQNIAAFSTSQIDGNYAFGIVGADQFGSRFGMAGAVTFNGSGAISGVDDSDSGVVQSDQTLSASDFSVVSTGAAAGLGTATITSTLGNTHFVFYVVSSSEMLMMAFDTTETPPVILSGQVLQQSGIFTDASLDGVSVIELQSLGSNIEPTAAAGLFTTTVNSATYTYGADENQGGTMSTPSDSGTFSISSNGRVRLVSTGGNFPPVLYLIAPSQAFVIGTDGGVSFGTMEPQTGSSFNAASLTGNYLGGSQPPTSSSVSEEADSLDFNGTNAVSGTSDQNSSGGLQSQAISATYSVSSNGRVVVSESGAPILYLYIVSASQAVALPVSSTQNPYPAPRLIDFHQ